MCWSPWLAGTRAGTLVCLLSGASLKAPGRHDPRLCSVPSIQEDLSEPTSLLEVLLTASLKILKPCPLSLQIPCSS